MEQITLRRIPDEVEKMIKKEAEKKGWSLNKAFASFLEKATGMRGKEKLLHKYPVELTGYHHKKSVSSILMISFRSHPVEHKESHIQLSTKRLRPQKNRGLFRLLPHGVNPSTGKGF